MWISIILSLVGLLFIYFEFFLPGGLIAFLGGLLIISGATLFSFQDIAIVYKIFYSIASIVAAFAICKCALWIIKNRHNENIYLSTDQEGFFAASLDKTLIGERGEVLSDLKPSGHILIKDKRYQALSDQGYISKNTKIIILCGQGGHYIVKEDK